MEARASRSALQEFKSGWPLLLAAMLGCGLGATSLPLYTAGVFFPTLESDFGWSRTEISFGVMLFTFSLAVASPVVGVLVDKFGVKVTASASILLSAGCYLLMATFLNGLPLFYAIHVAIAVLGAAAAPVAYTRVITRHFTRARGLALGLTLLGPSLVAIIAPAAISGVIERYGWSGGYLAIAAAMASVLLFIPLLRETEPLAHSSLRKRATVNTALFLGSTDRRTFALLMVSLALFSLGVGGLIVHLVPLLVDEGLATTQAAQIAGFIGLSGIVGRVVGGALADRVFAPFILVAVALLAAIGCLLFTLGSTATAIMASLSLGFSLGVEADLMAYLVSRYFRQEVYARIFGWQYAMFILGVGVSPLVLGRVRDIYGSYDPALIACACVLVAAAFLFGRLPRYEGQYRQGTVKSSADGQAETQT